MPNKNKKKKNLDHLSTNDNYQIYTNKSANSWYTRNYFYKNGIKSDAFGRVYGDPGYQPEPSKGTQYYPVSYSPRQASVLPNNTTPPNKVGKKFKHYYGLSNLSSSQNLDIQKQKIENSNNNQARNRIFNNKRTNGDKKNHFSRNYPPSPSLPPYPSNIYNIPSNFTKAYYTFFWARVESFLNTLPPSERSKYVIYMPRSKHNYSYNRSMSVF